MPAPALPAVRRPPDGGAWSVNRSFDLHPVDRQSAGALDQPKLAATGQWAPLQCVALDADLVVYCNLPMRVVAGQARYFQADLPRFRAGQHFAKMVGNPAPSAQPVEPRGLGERTRDSWNISGLQRRLKPLQYLAGRVPGQRTEGQFGIALRLRRRFRVSGFGFPEPATRNR